MIKGYDFKKTQNNSITKSILSKSVIIKSFTITVKSTSKIACDFYYL